MMMRNAIAIPNANAREHDDPDKREQRKPDDRFLSAIDNDGRREQGPECAAGISADLEDRLGKTEAPARAQMRDARCFRMENGGADPDECNREENKREIWREREQHQSDERRSHS